MIKRKVTELEVETGSGNVFEDLGLPDPEEHLVKADLAFRIGEIIRRRKVSQARAGAVLGLKQADASRLLNGDFRTFSVERLLRLLMALDRDIDIIIRTKPARARRPGRMQVIAAA